MDEVGKGRSDLELCREAPVQHLNVIFTCCANLFVRISEIYQSVQGEGFLTGKESIFVRVSGCNLRCWFCDTPYTSWNPEGEDFSVDEILERVSEYRCAHVVVTGGEPLLFAEMIPLCDGLKSQGHHITMETAGTLYLPLVCDLMSISPKLSSSTPAKEVSAVWHERHERSRHVPSVIQRLIENYDYQLKFVVGSMSDCEEVERYLNLFPLIRRDRVLLMPEGIELEKLRETAIWLEPYCHHHGLHFCPRKHIEWYGARRGT